MTNINLEHKQFLTEQCNRLKYGKCCTLGCLERGGYEKGNPPNCDKATCIPYEIHQELFGKENQNDRQTT